MKDVKDKNVIITGAAMGMGKIFARKFALDGARLVLVDVNEEALKHTGDEIRGLGAEVATYVCDLSKRSNVEELADKVHAEVGKMDVVVNNAGVVFGGPFLEIDQDRHDLTLNVNAMAVIWMTRAFLPDMIEKGAGHFLNMASASGLLGLPKGASYAASKWAVIGFGESIRLEMAEMGHKNIKVTTVAPSYIRTGMFDGVNAPLMTPILDPEDVVEKAYRAFKNDRIIMLEPFMVKVTPFLKGVLPPPIFDAVGKLFGVTRSMDAWKGHG